MTSRLPSRLTALMLAAALPLAGHAQTLPADCSTAAPPKSPVAVSVVGTTFTPKLVKLRHSGSMKSGDDEFDSYELALRSEDSLSPPLESSVTFLVRKGQRLRLEPGRRLLGQRSQGGILLDVEAGTVQSTSLSDPREAREDPFDYIERFYNPRSKHSTLGNISSAEFERKFVT